MSPNPPRQRPGSRRQTSLRTLLLIAFAAGPLLGIYGPRLVQAIREWKPSPPAPPTNSIPSWVQLRSENEPNGYYESAETPLR